MVQLQRADRDEVALVAIGNFLFGWRNLLFPVLFVAAAGLSHPRMLLGSARADRWMDFAGLALALSGQALRIVVIGLAYIRRGGKEGKIHADSLVTGGIFAHSRNPLYLGNILVFAGLLTALNSPSGWLIGAPFYAFAYWAIVAAEERFLSRKFGAEYDEYRRRVNRFVPSPRGLAATLRSMRFDWRRVVRKEYGGTFAWVSAFLAVILLEHFVWDGAAGLSDVGVPVAATWAAAILAYATARTLKKMGRLRLQ